MRLAFVDFSAIFRAAWHASGDDDISSAGNKTLSRIVTSVAGYDAVAVCVDRPPYLRKKLNDSYKSQREKQPEALYELQRKTLERVEAEGLHVLGADGHESDDCIATLVEHYLGVAQTDSIDIFSADKDLLALVGPKVHVISTTTGQVYDIKAVEEKFGLPPSMVPQVLALAGDTADNIDGLKGVGLKTAADWLRKYGSIQGIAQSSALLPPRFAEMFPACLPLLETSLKLITLVKNVPIDCASILQPKEKKPVEETKEPESLNSDTTSTTMTVHVPADVRRAEEATNVEHGKALEPRTPEQAWKLANFLYRARTFQSYPNAEAILSAIMIGRSLGVDAVPAVLGFRVIKGQPAMTAQFAIGLVKKSHLCEYFRLVESTPKLATWECKRRGNPEPTRISYSIEHAAAAGLAGNDNYKKQPETMLQWRAGMKLARLEFPDLIGGLYAQEELDE